VRGNGEQCAVIGDLHHALAAGAMTRWMPAGPEIDNRFPIVTSSKSFSKHKAA
jgi:hypothetical protein